MADITDKPAEPHNEAAPQDTPTVPQPAPRSLTVTQQLPATIVAPKPAAPRISPPGIAGDTAILPSAPLPATDFSTMHAQSPEVPKSPAPPKMLGSSGKRLYLRPGSRLGALVTFSDLTAEKFLRDAPRMEWEGKTVPCLGEIPLLGKLGAGGMGAVYYGINPRVNTEVAVKVLPFHLVERDQTLIDRFVREAQIAAQVRSPHIAAVMDVDNDNGQYYLVMEYVSGLSGGKYLNRVRESGRLGLAELDALEFCIAAAKGLQTAHQSEVIHRDVKPDNIIVPYNLDTRQLEFANAKILDLGLARVATAEGQSGPTGTESAMGTPGYMSPEQALDARSVDKRSDIFSLGVTLYALLTGRSPFHRENPLKSILAAAQENPPWLRTTRPDVSKKLEQVVAKCMEKDRSRRYLRMDQVIDELNECVKLASPARDAIEILPVGEESGGGATPKPPPLVPANKDSKTVASTHIRLARRQQLTRTLAIAGLVLAVCAGAGIFAWKHFGRDNKAPAEFSDGYIPPTHTDPQPPPDPSVTFLKNLASLDAQIQDASIDATDFETLSKKFNQLDLTPFSKEAREKIAVEIKTVQAHFAKAETDLVEKLAKPIESLLRNAQKEPFELATGWIESAKKGIESQPCLRDSLRGQQLMKKADFTLSFKQSEAATAERNRKYEAVIQAGKAALGKGLIDADLESKLKEIAADDVLSQNTKDAKDLLVQIKLWRDNAAARKKESDQLMGSVKDFITKGLPDEAEKAVKKARENGVDEAVVLSASQVLNDLRNKTAETSSEKEKHDLYMRILGDTDDAIKADPFSKLIEQNLAQMEKLSPNNSLTESVRATMKKEQTTRLAFDAKLAEATTLLNQHGKTADAAKTVDEAVRIWKENDKTLSLRKRIIERKLDEEKEAAFAAALSEAKAFLAKDDLQNAQQKLQEAQDKFSENDDLKAAWRDYKSKREKKQQEEALAARKAQYKEVVAAFNEFLKNGELDAADRKLAAAKALASQTDDVAKLSTDLDRAKQARQARLEQERLEQERSRRPTPPVSAKPREGTAGNSIPAD